MEPFSDEAIPMVTARPRACPRCGSSPLGQVADCEAVHWLCRSCGHCWHEVDGRLRAVDALSCPGCSTKPSEECIAQISREFPRFSLDDPG
jgi:hypothetical protein